MEKVRQIEPVTPELLENMNEVDMTAFKRTEVEKMMALFAESDELQKEYDALCEQLADRDGFDWLDVRDLEKLEQEKLLLEQRIGFLERANQIGKKIRILMEGVLIIQDNVEKLDLVARRKAGHVLDDDCDQ